MSRLPRFLASAVAILFAAAACTDQEPTGPTAESLATAPSFSHTISCDATVTETGTLSIQDAVNAASAGETICVEAGTFTENVDIDKAVNLIGAGPANTTLESANSLSSFLVRIADGNSLVTLSQGMELSGFTFQGPLDDDNDLLAFRATVLDANDPIIIRNNVFDCDDPDDAIVGVESASVGDMENAVIEDNTFKNRCRFAMFLNSAINWTIQNNTVQDSRFGGFVLNTSDPGRLNNIDILNNTFTSGVEDGGDFEGNQFVASIGLSSVMFDVEVSGNTIEGSSGHSITVGDRGNTVLTGMNIECNDMTNNAFGAHNDFGSNEVILAENNWWGASDGPSGVGPGTGDPVTEGFDFDPFLTAPVSDPCPPVQDDEPPVVTDVVATPNPVSISEDFDLTANVDDSGLGDSEIISAEYSLDGDPAIAMAAADGAFDEVSEDVEALDQTHGKDPGLFPLCVRGTDAAGNTSADECITLVVFDPDGGFVTGGGWIDSPAGAFKPDETLTGKANFGFVSKYKKGADTPEGNTEFQFKVADLNFHSTSYDFLIVNQGGTNAQFKGSGTINGSLAPTGDEFRFMLWAGDGDPDTFRIRIWYEDAEGDEIDVYDNGFDQPIGGGNIIVHKK